MALTVNAGSPGQSASIVNFYSGGLTSDAGAAADTYLNFGFQARYIKLYNVTDLSTQEFFDGMASGVYLNEVAAGTKTAGSAGMIVDNNGVTLAAAIIPASKTFFIVAFA